MSSSDEDHDRPCPAPASTFISACSHFDDKGTSPGKDSLDGGLTTVKHPEQEENPERVPAPAYPLVYGTGTGTGDIGWACPCRSDRPIRSDATFIHVTVAGCVSAVVALLTGQNQTVSLREGLYLGVGFIDSDFAHG